ncbi:MAG: Hsp20/alpha crystallin family protein, partial [Pseudomonadota bacterium]
MAKNKTPMEVKHDAPAPAESRRSPFTALRGEIDRIFDDFDPFSPRMWREGPGSMMRRISSWEFAPAIDMVEKGDRYEITAEIPGLSEKDIDIRVTGDTLTIRGEKREEEEKEEKNMRYSERRYGAFQRSFA